MVNYIRTNSDLVKSLKPLLYQYMLNLKEQLPEYLKEFITHEYYEQYSPKIYERQYRILSAIMTSDIKDIGNGYELELHIDPDKVSYDPSLWISDGITYYKKGDDSNTVFHNMANGIHGSAEFAITPGRFWEEFISEIDKNGIYDIFNKFKTYLRAKTNLSIK